MTRPSPLDRLRARYDELDSQRQPTVVFPVGHGVTDTDDGVGVGLAVEYREPDWLRNREIVEKWRKSTDERAELYSAAEQLAACCVDVLARDDENGGEREGLPGRWAPGLGAGEGPVLFAKAAVLLGRQAEDGLQAVFAVLRSDWEVDRHMKVLAIWEPGSESSREVEDAFAGESEPTPS